jgi:cyclin-dependent kinase-like
VICYLSENFSNLIFNAIFNIFNFFRHLQIFSQNEFFRGITLPVPPTIETLESKMPPRVLQNPFAIDFLKVFIQFFMPLSDAKIFLFKIQKCLDKDPNKRWSCDRLLQHPYFDDFIDKTKDQEITTATLNDTRERQLREKSKISQTSLPTLVQRDSEGGRVQQKNTYSRAEFNHLPTI